MMCLPRCLCRLRESCFQSRPCLDLRRSVVCLRSHRPLRLAGRRLRRPPLSRHCRLLLRIDWHRLLIKRAHGQGNLMARRNLVRQRLRLLWLRLDLYPISSKLTSNSYNSSPASKSSRDGNRSAIAAAMYVVFLTWVKISRLQFDLCQRVTGK